MYNKPILSSIPFRCDQELDDAIEAGIYHWYQLRNIARYCVQRGHQERLESLIQNGIKQNGFMGLFYNLRLDFFDEYYACLFQEAIDNRKKGMLQFLASHGCNIHWGEDAAFLYAVESHQFCMAMELIQLGANVSAQSNAALRYLLSLEQEYPQLMRKILKNNSADDVFYDCVKDKDFCKISRMLSYGFDINQSYGFRQVVLSGDEQMVDCVFRYAQIKLDSEFESILKCLEERHELILLKKLQDYKDFMSNQPSSTVAANLGYRMR